MPIAQRILSNKAKLVLETLLFTATQKNKLTLEVTSMSTSRWTRVSSFLMSSTSFVKRRRSLEAMAARSSAVSLALKKRK
jgi:hypothetical protein